MVKVTAPTLLRLMVVDVDKDWGGYKITNLGAPTAAKEALRYGDEALVDHDALKNFVAAEHVSLPAAITVVLTDHTKAVHDALAINADQVDGEHAAAITTNARVKAHFPDTIVNILSDHDKAAHDALNIDADTVDGEQAAAIVTNARVKAHFPDTVAAILSDHDLTRHPLAIIPTMDDGHIPNLTGLTGFPATDPVAGIGGLRTLGAGAQQAAAGNHTHTLVAEAQSVTANTHMGWDNDIAEGRKGIKAIAAGGDQIISSKTDTFSALSKAVAGFGGHLSAETSNTLKARLFMGGFQVAESGYIATTFTYIDITGSRSLSGSQTVYGSVHNYGGVEKDLYSYGISIAGNTHVALIVGSVAI